MAGEEKTGVRRNVQRDQRDGRDGLVAVRISTVRDDLDDALGIDTQRHEQGASCSE